MISLVTFTGIDKSCDFADIRAFARRYPFVEFGILLSLTPEDKDARYMMDVEIDFAIDNLRADVPLALHICGSAVTHFVKGTNATVLNLAKKVGRVQLNFNAARKIDFTISELDSAVRNFPGKVITQHFPGNANLVETISSPNHQVLHDTSGGRGIETTRWQAPFYHKVTGYAGGLGPDGIGEAVDAIQTASGTTPVWIDMESRIRTSGLLDLDKCDMVASAVLARSFDTGSILKW